MATNNEGMMAARDRVRPVEREVAAASVWGGVGDGAYQSMLGSDWRRHGSLAGGPYGLFQEMEDKDAHLAAVLQTRKLAVLACGMRVMPAGAGEQARRAARMVERALERIPDLHGALYQLLDALGKGFSLAEVVWDVDPATGEVSVSALKSRYQGGFAFDGAGDLWMLDDPASAGMSRGARTGGRSGGGGAASAAATAESEPDLLPRPGETSAWATGARRMPGRKFVHFASQGGGGGSPYGTALCARAYWYHWFKKQNLKFWAVFNEKFGAPTAVARYGPTTNAEEVERLAQVLEGLQNDAGVLLPEGVTLEFLEARRSSGSGGSTYRELADWCNDEISKLVLGQTLTTGEGRRSGSMALGDVHDRVRRDYLAADARALGEVLSRQLARWIVDFNLGPDAPAPRVVFDCADVGDLKADLELDQQMVKLGVALPAAHFYEHYRRPRPAPGELSLRFDDTNLYQYHLQFGVLTINEARESLGLPPVAWGEQRPGSPSAASKSLAREEGAPREQDFDLPPLAGRRGGMAGLEPLASRGPREESDTRRGENEADAEDEGRREGLRR